MRIAINERQEQRRTAKGEAQEGLPLEDYDSLSAEQIVDESIKLGPKEVERLCRYERAKKNRRNLLKHFQERIGAWTAPSAAASREDPPLGEERPERRGRIVTRRFAREEPPPGEERPQRRAP